MPFITDSFKDENSINLSDGLEVLRVLHEPLKKNNIAVSLGGSIAYRGTSRKDIDIIVYPYEPNQVISVDFIVGLTSGLGFTFEGLGGSGQFDDVLVFSYHKMRVDLIVLKR